jgi:hypothetical protein
MPIPPGRGLPHAPGRVAPGYDPAVWRYDDYGHLIRFADYGDRQSAYGWEIDHIHATMLGGSDSLDNLRPLHCRQNASLGGMLGGLFSLGENRS